MRFLFVLAMIATNVLNTNSQDILDLNANNGSIKFKPILHASIFFNINGKVVYVDPWGDKSLYDGLPAPDYIVITDIHHDHLSIETIESFNTENTKFIVPKAVQDQMPAVWQKQSLLMNNGDTKIFDKMAITAVPMYNLPEADDAFHVKGRGNGYVIESDDFRIYISGDTEDTPEMRSLKNIDIAFVCMNQPYTMTVESAAEGVKAFKPKVVYPYHYRNGDKSLSDINLFASLVAEEGIEVVILDWYK